jgi:alpha/beta superfamily hydrolase
MKTPTHTITIAATPTSPDLSAITVSGDEGNRMPAVVAPPHPLYGGSIAIPAVGAVFDALVDAGFAPTAFNWRGVGASGGETSGELEDAVADYRSAAAHVAGEGPLLAAGYSWGAVAALVTAADNPHIERLVLIAPPVAMLEDQSILQTGRPMHIVAGSDDMFAPRELLEQVIGDIDGATLDIIEEADHFFSAGGMDRIESLVRAKL